MMPGNTPMELAPYIAPGVAFSTLNQLIAHMRERLATEDYTTLTPIWAELVRQYLRALSRKQKRFGYKLHLLSGALAQQTSDSTVLRIFMVLAQELVL
jgi:hypothetical protein